MLETHQAELPTQRVPDDFAPRATQLLANLVELPLQFSIESNRDDFLHVIQRITVDLVVQFSIRRTLDFSGAGGATRAGVRCNPWLAIAYGSRRAP